LFVPPAYSRASATDVTAATAVHSACKHDTMNTPMASAEVSAGCWAEAWG